LIVKVVDIIHMWRLYYCYWERRGIITTAYH